MKLSLTLTLFLMSTLGTTLAQTDAASYFDGKPWGWATCADEAGTAYVVDGGMRAEQPRTIVLRTNGGDNAAAIKAAIAQYDIIVLDGTAGPFRIDQQMVIANANHKTIVGRNGAVLATAFYLTDADIAYLKQQGLEGLSSTDQYTGTLPDGTSLTCDRRAFFTKKAMMELQYQKTGVYSLPNKAGIFRFDSTCENIIVRNLTLQGPGAVDIDGSDLIYDAYANHLWIDHCTLIDSQDGALDTRGNYNTYTWNNFYYTSRSYSHAYVCGLGWVSNHSNVLHVTWGYNLWGPGCQRRLPQADDAYLHLVNNYHNCPGNAIGITLNSYTTALVEGNYAAAGVKDPLAGSGEKRYILARNNNFTYASTTNAVTLPYTYAEVLPNAQVPGVLTATHGAGATLDDCFMPLGYNQLSAETFGFYQEQYNALVGNSIQLPLRNLCGAVYSLRSSNEAVVTVNETGTARAVSAGTARVEAVVDDPLYGSYTASVTIQVTQPSAFVTYRKWDFSTFSSQTLANLAADAAQWSDAGDNYANVKALSSKALVANNEPVAEAEDLLFTSPAGKFAIYKGGRLRLNKEGSAIVLPSLQKDDKVILTWKSTNSSTQRGFTTQNLTVASLMTDGTQATRTASVVADGPVTLTVTGGIYLTSIEVQRQQTQSAISTFEAYAPAGCDERDLLGREAVLTQRGLRVKGDRIVMLR